MTTEATAPTEEQIVETRRARAADLFNELVRYDFPAELRRGNSAMDWSVTVQGGAFLTGLDLARLAECANRGDWQVRVGAFELTFR